MFLSTSPVMTNGEVIREVGREKGSSGHTCFIQSISSTQKQHNIALVCSYWLCPHCSENHSGSCNPFSCHWMSDHLLPINIWTDKCSWIMSEINVLKFTTSPALNNAWKSHPHVGFHPALLMAKWVLWCRDLHVLALNSCFSRLPDNMCVVLEDE